MTRSLLKLSCIAGLLILSFGTGKAVQISPKQMDDEPLVETLRDPKPGDNTTKKIIEINDTEVLGHLRELVRGSVEETLNNLLDAEADTLCGAKRYGKGSGKGSERGQAA